MRFGRWSGAALTLLLLWGATAPARTPAGYRLDTVVSPAWVRNLLDFHAGIGAPPSAYANRRYVILEASWATLAQATEYRAGHLPGAIHLNTDELENGYPRWLLRPLSELQQVIGAHGIAPETTVIVYGKQAIAAARVWWVLNYSGVTDVRLLDGGLAAWMAAGYATETVVRRPQPVEFSAQPRTEWLATTEYVRQRLGSRQTVLADARSHAEFVSERSGYAYLNFKGRIPGAVSIGDADDAARFYVNADGSLRDPADILTRWKAAGLANDDREAIFYCGSGWRSSLAFLCARALGFERMRNYSDGWAGWSTVYTPDPSAQGSTPGWRQQRTGNPIVVGTAPEARDL